MNNRIYYSFGVGIALVLSGCTDNNETESVSELNVTEPNVPESNDPEEVSLIVEINGEEIEADMNVLCWESCDKDLQGAPVPAEDFESTEPVYEVANGDIMEITHTGNPDEISFTAVHLDTIIKSPLLVENETPITGPIGINDYAVYLAWYVEGNEYNVSGIVEAAFTLDITE